MQKTFLEIVEMPDGRIVLRRAEGEAPMVTLTFSKEARDFLQDKYIEVARSMFYAGLEAAGEAINEQVEDEDEPDEQPTLH